MSSPFPKPPFPEQPQTMPGKSPLMDPPPDYGEDSYRGVKDPGHCRDLIARATEAFGLCHDQGRHPELHRRAGPDARQDHLLANHGERKRLFDAGFRADEACSAARSPAGVGGEQRNL